MKNFESALQMYKERENDYEEKRKIYLEVYDLWKREVKINGYTEKEITLGAKVDKAASDLDEVEKEYNRYAHLTLKYYMLS